MKLYYWQKGNGKENFGDNLNPWLWNKIIPDYLDDDPQIAFIGIGTLINGGLPKKTPQASTRILFSTGVGYGKSLLKIDSSYKIYCVRGALSAKKLGLDPSLAITDGGILTRKYYKVPTQKKTYKFSFMPHRKLVYKGWKDVCQYLGFGYIDPTWSTEKVLDALSTTEILLAEAMHGAIVADALRIPWIPIVTHKKILSFKWEDWCSSIQVEYNPQNIQLEYSPQNTDCLDYLDGSKSSNLSPMNTHDGSSNYDQRKSIGSQLKKISQSFSPVLSSDTRVEELTNRLEEKIEHLKSDIKSGVFTLN